MHHILNLTQTQPEDWQRYKIEQCFSVLGTIMGSNSKLQAEKGDVIVNISKDGIKARVAEEDETVSPGLGGLLRSKGIMSPEFMAMILSDPRVAGDLIKGARDEASVFGQLKMTHLRHVIVAVPDPQTQAMMIEAYRDSVSWLHQYADHLQKQSNLVNQMGLGIAGEILRSKAGRREALEWVSKVVNPSSKPLAIDSEVKYLGLEDVQSEGPGHEYVSKEQHQARVDALLQKIESLEKSREPSDSPSKHKSVRP